MRTVDEEPVAHRLAFDDPSCIDTISRLYFTAASWNYEIFRTSQTIAYLITPFVDEDKPELAEKWVRYQEIYRKWAPNIQSVYHCMGRRDSDPSEISEMVKLFEEYYFGDRKTVVAFFDQLYDLLPSQDDDLIKLKDEDQEAVSLVQTIKRRLHGQSLAPQVRFPEDIGPCLKPVVPSNDVRVPVPLQPSGYEDWTIIDVQDQQTSGDPYDSWTFTLVCVQDSP